MSLDEWVHSAPTIDPEVRAHVYSLVTAVGGPSSDLDGHYVLGDDAYAVLRDLRRWIRFYDQKHNRYDVARCLAEANLVKGDLLEILASWPENATENRIRHKISLACVELLVPLTWPLEPDPQLTKVNHLRHIPYLKLAQVEYKRAILQHPEEILRTVVRVALPSMAVPRNERDARDEGIIRITLYFLRNVAMIAPPPDLPSDVDETEVSRSATIKAFHDQDIFQLLLTLSSSMGEEFVVQDVIVLETLFYLLKGIDPEKLFMEEQMLAKSNTEELKSLISKEKAMLAQYSRNAPTRHNRFGTMIWVKRGEDKVSTLSGQDVLGDAQRSLQKMDKTKKWNKPRFRGRKQEEGGLKHEIEAEVALSDSARKQLRSFVEEFLDSSFNPLFSHLRKAIEREVERIDECHPPQFFYLISWFLEAERARRKLALRKAGNTGEEAESFALIASVMNQETFVLMNRFMQNSQDNKQWQDLGAGMRCFTQILLTVQEMCESSLEEDQEIAENIQSRIFYEESTHDRVIGILRNYKDQGFGYLDTCTELSHVFLRMLERYSKQNVDLQVRSRRRARKKRKEKAAAENGEEGAGGDVSEAEDVEAAQRTSTERKFDFARFAAKFMTQKCVDTFVALTKYYQDLDAEQLKRAHRFFHRVAFKMESGVLLYRVDILQLFHKMIKGPEGLDPAMPAFKEWEELVRHLFRKVIKKLEERPALVIELLFSKINSTIYYLEHGHDKELPTRAPRPPAELEMKPGLEKEQEIGVAVSILLNQGKADALAWIKDVLSQAASERQAWLDMEAAKKQLEHPSGEQESDQAEETEAPRPPSILVKPDNDERRVATFKDNKLRLLMKVLGFQRLGELDDPEASWIVPSDISSTTLLEYLELVRKFEFEPPTFEDGKGPESFIRSRAAAQRRKAHYDDDSEGGTDAEDFLFPAGGPTSRKSDALEALKSKRRRRRRSTSKEVDDEELARRREARREADLQRRKKVKSAMYVNDSDDETDEEADREFFAKEEARRKETGKSILKALTKAAAEEQTTKKRKPTSEKTKSRKKRKGSASASEASDVDVMSISSDDRSSSEAEDEEEDLGINEPTGGTDTPLSSHTQGETTDDQQQDASVDKAPMSDAVMAEADEDEEDIVPVRSTARRAVRAGFVVESDSDLHRKKAVHHSCQLQISTPKNRIKPDSTIRARWEEFARGDRHIFTNTMPGRVFPRAHPPPATAPKHPSRPKTSRIDSLTSFTASLNPFSRKPSESKAHMNTSKVSSVGAKGVHSQAKAGQKPALQDVKPQNLLQTGTSRVAKPKGTFLPRSQTIHAFATPKQRTSPPNAPVLATVSSSTNLPRSKIPSPTYTTQSRAKYIGAGQAFGNVKSSTIPRSETQPLALTTASGGTTRPFVAQRRSTATGSQLSKRPEDRSGKENVDLERLSSSLGGYLAAINERGEKAKAKRQIANAVQDGDTDSKHAQQITMSPSIPIHTRKDTPITVQQRWEARQQTNLPRLASTTRIPDPGQHQPLSPRVTHVAPALRALNRPTIPVKVDNVRVIERSMNLIGSFSETDILSADNYQRLQSSDSDSSSTFPPPSTSIPAASSVRSEEAPLLGGGEWNCLPQFGPVVQVFAPQSVATWAGRFMSLSDHQRNAAFDVNMPAEEWSDDRVNAARGEERRVRAIFAQLQDLCVTEEARDSLRLFQARYADVHRMPTLAPVTGLRMQLCEVTETKIGGLKSPGGNGGCSGRKTSFIEKLMGKRRKNW